MAQKEKAMVIIAQAVTGLYDLIQDALAEEMKHFPSLGFNVADDSLQVGVTLWMRFVPQDHPGREFAYRNGQRHLQGLTPEEVVSLTEIAQRVQKNVPNCKLEINRKQPPDELVVVYGPWHS